MTIYADLLRTVQDSPLCHAQQKLLGALLSGSQLASPSQCVPQWVWGGGGSKDVPGYVSPSNTSIAAMELQL